MTLIGKGRITHVLYVNCIIFFLIRHFIREVFFSWISTFSLGRCVLFVSKLSCIQVKSVSVFEAERYVTKCAAGCCTCACLCFVLNGVTFRNDIESSVRDAVTVYCSGSDIVLNTAVCVSLPWVRCL